MTPKQLLKNLGMAIDDGLYKVLEISKWIERSIPLPENTDDIDKDLLKLLTRNDRK